MLLLRTGRGKKLKVILNGKVYKIILPNTGSKGLVYTLSEDETHYCCSGIGTSMKTDVVIADTYNYLPVKAIAQTAFKGCSSLISITIPNSVMTIGHEAFLSCSKLASVAIPDSIISIGNAAFAHCNSLTSIAIPDSVESIGADVFANSTKLAYIEVSDNSLYYKDIDGNLYSKDGKKMKQYAIGKTATSFTIPSGVETIASKAFSYCSSLTTVEIPSSVRQIEYSIFASCDNLNSIKFTGTVDQWNKINIDTRWNNDMSVTKVVCNDGDIIL